MTQRSEVLRLFVGKCWDPTNLLSDGVPESRIARFVFSRNSLTVSFSSVSLGFLVVRRLWLSSTISTPH